MKKQLTEKQIRFIDNYVISLNASDAALKAGYSGKTARFTGCQLLTEPTVKAEIDSKLARAAKKLEITHEMILEELAKIAFAKASDFYEWGTGGIVLKDSRDIDTTAISEISETRSTRSTPEGDVILNSNVKIKAHDKLDALKELDNRLYGTPKQSVEVSGSITLEQVRANLLGMVIDVKPKEITE